MTESGTAQLDRNIKVFEAQRQEWLRRGLHFKWFVIANGEVVGHYDDPEAAYRAALSKAKPGDFMIRQLLPVDRPDSVPALQVGAIARR